MSLQDTALSPPTTRSRVRRSWNGQRDATTAVQVHRSCIGLYAKRRNTESPAS
jgi:hypothetical protein